MTKKLTVIKPDRDEIRRKADTSNVRMLRELVKILDMSSQRLVSAISAKFELSLAPYITDTVEDIAKEIRENVLLSETISDKIRRIERGQVGDDGRDDVAL